MKSKALSSIKIIPLLLLIIFVGIAPVGNALYNAFFHDFYGERSFAGLDNFKKLLQDQGFFLSLRITVLWAVLNTILSLFFSFIFAVKLSKKNLISSLFYLILLIPWGIPIYIAVPLWRALLHGSGGTSLLTMLFGLHINLLIDPYASFLASLFVSIWLITPLTTFVFLGAIKKIPKNIIEAARIDGASDAQLAIFFYLPHIRESLLVMGILNFLKSFKEFTLLFLMTSGGPPLLSGFTDRHIIGATTTLEIFLFDIFNTTDDFGIPASFAVVMAGIVLIIMGVWFLIRSRSRNHIKIKLFTAAVQIIAGGPLGFLWTAGYLVSLKWKLIFSWTVGLQMLVEVIRLCFKGFLSGFNPGIVIAIFGFFLLRAGPIKPKKHRLIFVKKYINPLWNTGSSLICAVIAVSSLLLLYLVIWMSLSRISAAYVDTFIPRFFTLSNFKKIVVDEQIFKYFMNTLIVSAFTGLIIPLLTFPAASYLTNRSLRFSNGFLTFIQIIGITGGMHLLIPLYSIFRSLRLLNSYLPLVLIYLSHSVPFSLFTIKAYLDSMPASLRENALLEGMGPISYLVKVLFPLSFPVITTSVMAAFLSAWNGFLAPLLFLNDDSKYTISVKLYSLIGNIASGNPKWNLFAAASLVNIILLSFLFIHFKNPLTKTAIIEYQD